MARRTRESVRFALSVVITLAMVFDLATPAAWALEDTTDGGQGGRFGEVTSVEPQSTTDGDGGVDDGVDTGRFGSADDTDGKDSDGGATGTATTSGGSRFGDVESEPEPKPETVVVVFHGNDEGGPSAELGVGSFTLVLDGTEHTLPTVAPTREGFDFAGWYTTPTSVDEGDMVAMRVADGQTLLDLSYDEVHTVMEPDGNGGYVASEVTRPRDLTQCVRDGRLELYARWRATGRTGAAGGLDGTSNDGNDEGGFGKTDDGTDDDDNDDDSDGRRFGDTSSDGKGRFGDVSDADDGDFGKADDTKNVDDTKDDDMKDGDDADADGAKDDGDAKDADDGTSGRFGDGSAATDDLVLDVGLAKADGGATAVSVGAMAANDGDVVDKGAASDILNDEDAVADAIADAGDVSDDDAKSMAKTLTSTPRMRGRLMSGCSPQLRGSAPTVTYPRTGDGNSIEYINAVWVTPDTVDDGDASMLYVRPTGDEAQTMRLRIAYSLSGEVDYEPGRVMITVPSGIWKYRGSDSYAGYLVIPYPESPKSSSDFNWTYNANENTYELVNTKRMSAGSKGYIEFDVGGIIPHRVVDMAQSDPFWARIDIATQGEVGHIALVSNELTARMDTEARVRSARKYNNYAEIVDSSKIDWSAQPEAVRLAYGDPAAHPRFVLASWYCYANLGGNTEGTLSMSDTKADAFDGFVVNATDAMGQTLSIPDLNTGYVADSDMGYRTVLVAYPLEQFDENVSYTLSNTVSYTLEETDPAVEDPYLGTDPKLSTTASATATVPFSWHMPVFTSPRGHFMVNKIGNDGADGGYKAHWYYYNGSTFDLNIHNRDDAYGVYSSALNQLRDGNDVEFSYTVETIGYVLPWTLAPGGNPRLLSDYGHRPVTMVTVDCDDEGVPGRHLYLMPNSPAPASMPLTLGDDYEYVAVEFPRRPSMGKATAVNLDESGNFVSLYVGDGTVDYESDPTAAVPPISLEAMVNGAWVDVATLTWPGDATEPTIAMASGAPVTGMRVPLPEGTEQIRTTTTTTAAYMYYYMRPVFETRSDGNAFSHESMERLFGTTYLPSLAVYNTTRMNAYDSDDAEIVEIQKQDAMDRLQGYRTDVAAYPRKSGSFVANNVEQGGDIDYGQRRIGVTFRASVEERSFIPRVPGSTENMYLQAIEDGQLVRDEECVWYDLLPVGVSADVSTVRLRDGDIVKDAYVEPNWRGSGRDLLVVRGALSPVVDTYVDGDVTRYMDKPMLIFKAYYSFEAWKDHGPNVHNVVAYESLSRDPIGDVPSRGGEPDDPRSDNNSATAEAFVSDLERDAMTDVSLSDSTGDRFVYAGCWVNMDVPTAARTELMKDVDVNSEGHWSTGTEANDADKKVVFEGGRYAYRLRTASNVNTISSDIIMYDTLENFVPTDGNVDTNDVAFQSHRWRGTLTGVDTSQMAEMVTYEGTEHCAPVVYYSEVPNLPLHDGSDETQGHPTNLDLTNGSIWTEASAYEATHDDLSAVHAVAIDASKTTEGNTFRIGPMDSVSAILYMRAPSGDIVASLVADETAPEGTAARYGAHAYNNVYLTATSTDANDITSSSHSFSHKDYTRVAIEEMNVEVRKVWNDDDDRDGLRPASITVELRSDGVPTGRTATLSEGSNWRAVFEHVPYATPDGDRISYDFVEQSVTGYQSAVSRLSDTEVEIRNVHEPERLHLQGEKTWVTSEGDGAVMPASVRVELYADGEYLMSRTVSAVDGRWSYDFGYLPRYRDHGTEIAYTVAEVVDDIRWDSTVTGLDVSNEWHPYGDLVVSKETLGQTPAFLSRRFDLVLRFRDASGLPIPGEFDYETSDGRTGKVSNGTSIALAGGESARILEVPHGTRYAVSEMAPDGYRITSSSGLEGTIVANSEVEASITNTYSATGQAMLAATKTLRNATAVAPATQGDVRPLRLYDFRVEIWDVTGLPAGEEGSLVRVGTNREDGSIPFGSIRYTQLDSGNTYRYRLVETQRTRNGYTYDQSVYYANVTVSDRGDGTLSTVVTYENASGGSVAVPEFKNTYGATGSLAIRAWKKLKGGPLTAGQFTFELHEGSASGTVIDTATNDADGNVDFDPITYNESQVGTEFVYVVTERAGSDPLITYSTESYTYRVTPSDNGDGTLSFEETIDDDATPLFTNSYVPGGLRIEKHVDDVPEGHENDEFHFRVELIGEGVEDLTTIPYDVVPLSAAIPAASLSDVLGSAWDALVDAFGPREALAADSDETSGITGVDHVGSSSVVHLRIRGGDTVTIPNVPAGTSYEVSEVNIPDGWSLDDILVENVSGTTGTVSAGQTSHAEVRNDYSADGSYQIVAYKELTGGEVVEGAYTFELRDSSNAVVATATNLSVDQRAQIADQTTGNLVVNPHYGQAAIEFPEIQVSTQGTYTYTVREVRGQDPTVRYDEHVETVTVNVNDVNHNGRLTCTVNYDGNGCVFTNSMREGSLLVSKDAIGATGSSQAFTFDVTLSAADGTPLTDGTYALTGTGAVSGANVSVSGGTATLSCRGGETIGIQGLPSGTTYVVTERSLPGWTQTESVGTEGSIRPNAVSNVRFVNSYSAAGSFDVMGTKTMDGNAPDGMEFTFELREEDGSLVGIAKNDSTGAFAFEGLGIDPLWVGTTRTYTVTEVNDMQAGVYYDDSVREVQVTFSDDGEGNLSGTVETPVGAPVSFANETASRRSPPVIEMPATGLAGIGGWHFLGLGAVAVALVEQARRLRSGRTDEGDQDR